MHNFLTNARCVCFSRGMNLLWYLFLGDVLCRDNFQVVYNSFR